MRKEAAYPAHALAAAGDAADLSALLPHGAGALNNWDETPLHLAAENGHPECCRLLLEAGADVNARDKDGATVLVYAVSKNRTTEAAKILINAGADKTAKYSGRYPYQWCNYYIDDTDVYTTLRNAVSSYSYW